MSERIFMTDYVYALPGLPGQYEIAKAMDGHEAVFDNNSESPFFGKLDFPEELLALIRKQDLKSMREDALAAGICSWLLMNRLDIDKDELISLPLFVATGVVIEKLFARKPKVLKYFNQALMMESTVDKNNRLSRILPPLLALETLTNAAETYAAQYGGMAGENTTFGGCSLGGFYSLKEGFDQIISGNIGRAVVGAVNLSGINSYRTFSPFFQSVDHWHESPCAVFMILESESNLKARAGLNAFELTKLEAIPTIPSLFEPQEKTFRDSILNSSSSSSLVFSGAFTDKAYELDYRACTATSSNSFSWYPSYGNLGSASVLMNLLGATHFIDTKKAETVECLDRDPDGRISKVRLKKYQL